jgi:hypothetical protein
MRDERGMARWSAEKVWVPFIGPEASERRWSVRELGRRPLMALFRAREEMGSLGDKGGGFSMERGR